MKKGKGSVEHFTDDKGVKYQPGDTIDLPVSYAGEKWLEQVEEPKKPKPPPAKAEPVSTNPLPEKKQEKRRSKH